MLLALLALALIALVLATPILVREGSRWRARRAARRPAAVDPLDTLYDPGRERRAERRARELLRSCVNDEEWGMYRELGFIRVLVRGRLRSPGQRGRAAGAHPASRAIADDPSTRAGAADAARPSTEQSTEAHPYAYLIYPHKPIVAY